MELIAKTGLSLNNRMEGPATESLYNPKYIVQNGHKGVIR